MTLSPGTRLGPYEVVSALGAGGMGQVYRARDTKLDRDVAIKVLPEALAKEAESLARFEREAKAVAALSHPNILAIHDFGTHEGIHFAVMELLEGETLRTVIARGPVGVRRALEITGQVAAALSAAHEKGIVHRDVKPENVFVTGDGQIRLLDFGLVVQRPALGAEHGTKSPTARILTEKGSVVGTVSYMSPEQARGEIVDFRTDQFSLGIVLYELLTGSRPFTRSSAVETMAAIIRDEPEPLEKVAPHVPAPVRWVVERLLAKEPASRYAATRDLVHELASLRAHLSETTQGLTDVALPRQRFGRLALAGFLVALASASVPASLYFRERGRPRPVPARFEIRLPEGHFLVPYRSALALSPDGKFLVFSAFSREGQIEEMGEPKLFVRPLGFLDSRSIPGTEGGVQPTFSPDGNEVAFAVQREGKTFLRRVPVAGGPVRTVCECDAEFGAAWARDGSILFAARGGPLQRVPATGGAAEPATTLDVAGGEVSHRLPHLLPDGQTVIYTALRWMLIGMTWKRTRIYAWRPGEQERALLVEGGSDGFWAPPGNLLFAREGRLLIAPLDVKARRVTGTPAPVMEGVRHSIWTGGWDRESGVAHVALAADGPLAWGPGSVQPPFPTTPVWIDAAGKETPIEGGPSPGPVLSGRVSRDGQRILLTYNYPGMQAEVLDIARQSRQRATFDVNPVWAIWGPGPERVTFTSDHEGPMGLYTRRVDAGPEEIETLWKPPDSLYMGLGSWSPDGKVLTFSRISNDGTGDIWMLEAGKEPRIFLATKFWEIHPSISPDGKWLLYSSDASGRFEVYAKALSGQGGTLQVSANGGSAPLWSRDGSNVYYWQPLEDKPGIGVLFRVQVTRPSESLAFGASARLFERRYVFGGPGHFWDVGPDGRFLVSALPGDAARRAWRDKILSNRVIVDTGGVAHLLAAATSGP